MGEVWINGELRDESAATIAFDDRGFTVGDGCFEAIKLDAAGPFAVGRHLRRLRSAADRMGIPLADDAILRAAIDAVTDGVDLGDGILVIRITLTAGRGGGTRRGDGPPTLVVSTRPASRRVDAEDVALSPWPRNERAALAGVKTTSYAENVMALDHAGAVGASEVLFANTVGELCEGAGSNVFLELDGELVTPALRSGCLPGVTRALLLEVGVGAEAVVPVESLGRTTEAFLTSTTREVQPIRTIDGRVLAAAPGPLTAAAIETWCARFGPGGPLDP